MGNRLHTAGEFLSQKLYQYGSTLENVSRKAQNCPFAPHYKYFCKPIYKACVKTIGQIAATALTFLSTDLVFHCFLPKTAAYLISRVIGINLTIPYMPLVTISHMVFYAAPVMYAKYKNNQVTKLA